MQNKGKFITIEGIDGCGKSTLAKKIKGLIGEQVLLTKEPGGSSLGKHLRTILQYQPEPVCDKAEYLLFAADRAQHYKQVILPALEQGKIVISDRWADSSVAYQGYGRGLDIDIIKKVNAWATNNIKPDFILYIKINAEDVLARVTNRNEEITVFEREKINFWNRVTQGYEELYANRKDVVVLDGKLSQDDLLKTAMEALNAKIG